MPTLLHISASPRGSASASLALAAAFLEAHAAAHPDVRIEQLDLWQAGLPTFGADGADAKMAVFGGGTPASDQVEVWSQAKAVFDRFAAADSYLFSIPMWNAGVPYILKQWIDIITQPGWIFGFDPTEGYSGLITGKKAAVIYTSGVYTPGAPLAFGNDFHALFFNDWLRFAGITDITEVRFQPTVLTTTPDDDRTAAHSRARDAGKRF